MRGNVIIRHDAWVCVVRRLVWSWCQLVACLFGDIGSLSLLFGRNKRHRGEAVTKLSAVRPPPSVNCCGCDDVGVRCLINISCSSAGCHAYSHFIPFFKIFLCLKKGRQYGSTTEGTSSLQRHVTVGFLSIFCLHKDKTSVSFVYGIICEWLLDDEL